MCISLFLLFSISKFYISFSNIVLCFYFFYGNKFVNYSLFLFICLHVFVSLFFCFFCFFFLFVFLFVYNTKLMIIILAYNLFITQVHIQNTLAYN